MIETLIARHLTNPESLGNTTMIAAIKWSSLQLKSHMLRYIYLHQEDRIEMYQELTWTTTIGSTRTLLSHPVLKLHSYTEGGQNVWLFYIPGEEKIKSIIFEMMSKAQKLSPIHQIWNKDSFIS